MIVPDRDRDTEGRPRQARPRDALGRPLPCGADGVEPVSEVPLPPDGVCVALTHAARGNQVGADRLVDRAADRLAAYAAAGREAYGIHVTEVSDRARRHVGGF